MIPRLAPRTLDETLAALEAEGEKCYIATSMIDSGTYVSPYVREALPFLHCKILYRRQ
jgi:hypothetical protein